jgi:hypothetical protein
VPHVGFITRVYRDARSTKHTIQLSGSRQTDKQKLWIVTLCVIVYAYNDITAAVCENYDKLLWSGCLDLSDYFTFYHTSGEKLSHFLTSGDSPNCLHLNQWEFGFRFNLVFDLQTSTQRIVFKKPVSIAN